MELKLQKLISDAISIADVRNLSESNPIKLTLKNPNGNSTTVVVVALSEPYDWTVLPVNVTWINYDVEDVNFKRALKRVSYDDPGTGSPYHNTWEVLEWYNDVFEPPQYYGAGGYGDIEDRFNDHIDTLNNPNPHQLSATGLGALPINGGTLLGPVIARSLGQSEEFASGELIPKVYVDELVSALNQQIADLTGQINANSGATYKHAQTVAATTWAVTHNLSSEDLIVQVYDENGFLMLADSVQSTGLNTLEIKFVQSLSGTALMVPVVNMPAP